MRLRAIVTTALLVCGIFSSLLYVSCKNKCGSTVCNNGGSCVNNACVCPTGYSDNACNTSWVTPYLGTYNCTSSSCSGGGAGAATWQSAITADATNSGYTIDISNFASSNQSITGTVDTLGNISVAPASGSYGISANGKLTTVDSTTITMHYTISSSTGIDVACTMLMKKI